MKKEYSLKKRSIRYILLLITVFLVFGAALIAVFTEYNYRSIQDINTGFLSDLCSDLESQMTNTQQYILSLLANNTDFSLLSRGASEDSYNTYLRSRNLQKMFSTRTSLSGEMFAYFTCKQVRNGYYSAYPSRYPAESQHTLDREIKQAVTGGLSSGQWTSLPGDTMDHYLLIAFRRNDTVIGALLDLNLFARDDPRYSGSYLFVREGRPVAGELSSPDAGINWEKPRSTISHFISSLPLAGTDLKIVSVIPQTRLASLIRTVVLVSLCFIALLGLIFFLVIRTYSRAILHPLEQISRIEQEIAESAPVSGIRSDILEYNLINDKILGLIRRVSSLQKEADEKDRALQGSRLQYYQLQTEPHFFLNCLKNIYALAEKQRYERIQYLVRAISDHFRYLFRTDSWTISLREELAATERYYQLCQISSSAPILLESTVEDHFLNYPVPKLLVQTFVENSMKYAIRENEILRIQISSGDVSDDSYRILIQDNGKGYPDEVLEASVSGHFPDNGHIGIRNLTDRLALFYGDRAAIHLHNTVEGGAVTELVLPKKQ